MLREVWSGGQRGADQAGWRAARAVGLPTTGFMPAGYRTESPDGRGWGERHPEYAELYGAREHQSEDYPPRTHANAAATDGTIWFGDTNSFGFRCTANACRRAGNKPLFIIEPGVTASVVAAWINVNRIERVNIAGNRASTNPELGPKVERFLVRVFRLLK